MPTSFTLKDFFYFTLLINKCSQISISNQLLYPFCNLVGKKGKFEIMHRFLTSNFVWRSEIYDDRNNKQGGNKLRTYRLFKDNISLEKYLLILNEDERRVLTKFRVSAHNLEIEKGRYIGVKTEDRICKLCNTGVEDETHFLLQCPVLENKRTQIINIKNVNINFNNLPNKSKLIWSMSSKDNFIIKNTSSLLCSLFKERDLVLKGN